MNSLPFPGLLSLTALFLAASGLSAPASPDAAPTPAPKVQLALLLDTSGSMEGLIHQARAQLWKIVNEFGSAKRDGRNPELEVALFEYGNDSISADRQWVRQITPLTRDLDEVSRRLFALSTNGGSEYCGAVIREAVQTLTWSADPRTYKAVFIAGNEPFTQGPVSAVEACRAATGKGITVNTIHCGSGQDGINGGWQQGAMLAHGSYLCIDQDKAIAQIPTPQDDSLAQLSRDLNGTYLGYGKQRLEKTENQAMQDSNANAAAPSAEVQRAVTKASRLYDNRSWDLVDAVEKDQLNPATLPKEDLPEALRSLSDADLKARIAKAASDRAAIQKKIQLLNQERETFLSTRAREAGGAETLDTAIARVVRDQAGRAGFTWEK